MRLVSRTYVFLMAICLWAMPCWWNLSWANQRFESRAVGSHSPSFSAPTADALTDSSRRYRAQRRGAFFYPLSLIGSFINLGFDWKLSPFLSARAVGAFAYTENADFYGVDQMTGGYIEGQLRFYTGEKALRGFYGGAFVYGKIMDFSYQEEKQRLMFVNGQYQYTSYTFGPYRGTAAAAGFGCILGHQLFLGDRIIIDFYLGPAIQFGQLRGEISKYRNEALLYKLDDNGWDGYNVSPKLHAGLAIGWAIY
jgi:hypothetical protein